MLFNSFVGNQANPLFIVLRLIGSCETAPSFNVTHGPAKPAPMTDSVHPTKSRVAAISIFVSAGMAVAKFVVGIAIGSLALDRKSVV